jgi:hypothetical protein
MSKAEAATAIANARRSMEEAWRADHLDKSEYYTNAVVTLLGALLSQVAGLREEMAERGTRA